LFKLILFTILFTFNLFALEISLSSAKENFQNYSTLHLEDKKPFLCQENRDDFNEVTKIICAFNKKPSSKVSHLQNAFFKIENKIKDKTFFIIITPFYKIKLYPVIFDMTKESSVYQADVKMAQHWMVVGYKKVLPYIKKEINGDTSIDFPFEGSETMIPYVGSLDIKGNPVYIKRVGDVSDYLRIKKLYKEKKYEKSLELIDDVLQEYPNSLFKTELIYYKIKVYAKLRDNENVIEYSKIYLREYSSDENVPEVLALVARAYSLIGLGSDADYFFDRLFSEHADSEYANWGYIYMGDMFLESGGTSKALSYFKKALNDTSDIEIAETAAYRLATYKMANGDIDEAQKYINKIVHAKTDFFMGYFIQTMDLMYQFADLQRYKTAASIADSILHNIDKNHDEYERLLKDKAIWLSKTDEKEKALKALDRYLEEFPNGSYDDSVKIAKDELFFDTNDGNFSVKIKEYDALAQKYSDDSIGDKAIYEKAKLLLENKFYQDVLDLKDSLLDLNQDIYTDIDQIIKDAAIGVMKEALKNKKCQSVINISSEHNITLSSKWDDGVYDCSMMGGDFTLATDIAKRNLKSSDIQKRKMWLFRYIKANFAIGKYKDVIEASKDLITLIDGDKNSKYKEVYRVLFDTYQRVQDQEKLLLAIENIQKIYSRDYKDIERYVAVMTMGEDKKDDNIIIKYGQEVYEIQKKSKSNAQSPYVEFTLYQAYLNKGDLQKALDVISSLDDVEISRSQRARQKYLKAIALSKLWRDTQAAKAYQEAIDADPSSPWAKLAKDAMNI
jgi:tetratricopeptide (TPR) repeat protein